MSCAEVLISHIDDDDEDGGDDEDVGGDGDGDYHLVSQRATCCFAESGSAFVNWELKVPENDVDAGWRKRFNLLQRWKKRIGSKYLAAPYVTSWMPSCNPSSLSLLCHTFFNPPQLECTQYWVTSPQLSRSKESTFNSVSCLSSISVQPRSLPQN